MIGKFLPAVLIALAEIILIPAIIFPLFYQYASPLLGCSPVGNGSLFNINIFSNSKIGTVCPVSIPIYYYLLAVLIIAMVIFYFIGSSFSDYFYLVVIAAATPSLIFVISGIYPLIIGYTTWFYILDVILLIVWGIYG